MPPRNCKRCSEQPKKKGNPAFCFECWLPSLPADEQELQLLRRKDAIPPALRKSRVGAADWPKGRRWCSGCQTFVRLSDVAPGAARCRVCVSTAQHEARVLATYGLKEGEYGALLQSQGGKCYLCGRKPKGRRLDVDHNHKTGEVRGLLCGGDEFSCNYFVIGTIEGITTDSALEMAKRIVSYFEEPPARSVLFALRSA